MIENAQQIFSSTMVVLFILLFIRSGWNLIGSIGARFDPVGTHRAALSNFVATKISFYARVCSLLARGNDFFIRHVGDGIMPVAYAALTPIAAILTSFLCVGVIVMTFMTFSLATFMQFYIVYVALQLPFVFCQMAFAGESVDRLGEVFVDVFWPAHKRTLRYLAMLAAMIRRPFVSA